MTPKKKAKKKVQVDPSIKAQKEHVEDLQARLRKAKLRLQHMIAAKSKSVKQRTISSVGINLITEFEGIRQECYNDSANNATIGIGHLLHLGPVTNADRKKWGKISQATAESLLRGDCAEAMKTIRDYVKVPLNQHQFDALVSFIFNVGAGNFRTSTLLRRLNAGDYVAVPSEMDRWVSDGKQKQPGLVRRRAAEGELFAKGH